MNKLHSSLRSDVLHGNKKSPVKDDDVIRQERKDTNKDIWVSHVRPKDWIPAVELKSRLILNAKKECSHNRLLGFSRLERMVQ